MINQLKSHGEDIENQRVVENILRSLPPIFENHVDVFGRGHYVPEGVNLHEHEVFYTKQGMLIPTKIIDGEYKYVYFNIYFSTHK